MFRWFRSHLDPAVPPAGTAYQEITYKTEDGIALDGYVVRCSSTSNSKCYGSILFAQGEGDSALSLIEEMSPFTIAGFDVYIFDFRGYRKSGGSPTASLLINDYRELARYVRANSQGLTVAYGGSLGGVILSNALDGTKLDGLILDSVSSKMPFLCSSELAPKNHIDGRGKTLLVISGTKDLHVTQGQTKELRTIARDQGSIVWDRYPWVHIFDSTRVDLDRFEEVSKVFLPFIIAEKSR